MTRILFFSVFCSVTSGCLIEYTPTAIIELTHLQRLGCDEEDNAAALPEDRPIAVCDASAFEMNPIHGRTHFIGEGSYDPNGRELIDHHWTLVEVPEGSHAKLGDGIENRWDFAPDLVGEYTAQLQVTNDQCIMSDPCEVTITAFPSQDLWVEMYWDKANDDMDLHLIEGNGSFGSEQDCNFQNCIRSEDGWSPDFGEPGVREDDAYLDLDDIEGTGPENINIDVPASGLYRVVVHDYPESANHLPNRVTVKIHLGGELVFNETRTITGEDKIVPFALIEWPSKSVKSLQ